MICKPNFAECLRFFTESRPVRGLDETWSGRRGSNPRRPAWEIDRGFENTEFLASTVLIAGHPNLLILGG